MADPKATLTLSTTEFDRPAVAIDGERYEMRSQEELSVEMMKRVMRLGRETKALAERMNDAEGEAADDLVDELAEKLRQGVDLVMVALPDEVHEKLTFGHQQAILRTFNSLAGDGNSARKSED